MRASARVFAQRGNMQFWWLIPIVLLACAVEGFGVYLLRYKNTLSLILVTVIAAFVMGYKTFEFAGYRIQGVAEYPIEFSHISYFVFGTIVLLGLRRLYGLAGYCATLTGLGNVIALCASPDSMISGFRSGGYFALSIILHNLMLFGGVLLLCNSVKFRIKDIWTAFLAIALICGFAQLVNAGLIYSDIDYKDSIVILKIMDGRIFEYIVPPEKLTVAGKVIGCIVLFLAVCGSVVLYYWGNNKIYARKEKLAEQKGIDISCKKIGIIPLVVYIAGKIGERKKALKDAQDCTSQSSGQDVSDESVKEKDGLNNTDD